jgi:hypothetical protein
LWPRGPDAVNREATIKIKKIGSCPSDAHAGVAEQKECVTVAIIAPQKFLLDESVLIGGQRAPQIMLQPVCLAQGPEVSCLNARAKQLPAASR